ncbi:unnamed protein product [Knipowitschia caucasica]
MVPLPDLRKVTILSKSESMRIQNEIHNIDRELERRIEEEKRREAMHLQSKEVVKLWPNTIATQRQKNLEAKAIRQQMDEDKRKKLDLEEAKYKEEKRKEAIQKATAQLFHQTERVKNLHSAYRLSHVLHEREAQIKFKQRMKSFGKDMDKTFFETAMAREEEAQRKEEEKVKQKKKESLAVVEELNNQIRKHDLDKEYKRHLKEKELDELQQQHELHLWEQSREQERRKEAREQLMQANQEHLTNKQQERAAHDRKERLEDEQRKLYLSAKEKIIKLRRDKEKEMIRETQMQREKILEKIVVSQQQQARIEELRLARVVAEREAREMQLEQEETERKAAMMQSIAEHRTSLMQEKERVKEEMKKKNEEMLQSKKEAQKIYLEKQQHKEQKEKEERQKLQEFHKTQMNEKHSKQQRQKQDMKEFEVMNSQLHADEEFQFQLYAKDIINRAEDSKLYMVPLYKAAIEGIGGPGPAYHEVSPSKEIQDNGAAQMSDTFSGAQKI